jgi:hypothetical protein
MNFTVNLYLDLVILLVSYKYHLVFILSNQRLAMDRETNSIVLCIRGTMASIYMYQYTFTYYFYRVSRIL